MKYMVTLSLTHKKFFIITSCWYHLRLVLVGQLIKLAPVKAVWLLKESRICPQRKMRVISHGLYGHMAVWPEAKFTTKLPDTVIPPGHALFLPIGTKGEQKPRKEENSITSWGHLSYLHYQSLAHVCACVCVCVQPEVDAHSGISQ